MYKDITVEIYSLNKENRNKIEIEIETETEIKQHSPAPCASRVTMCISKALVCRLPSCVTGMRTVVPASTAEAGASKK